MECDLLFDPSFLQHAIQDGTGNAQYSVAPLVSRLGGAKINYAWFILE
jgi:hypothetical protein